MTRKSNQAFATTLEPGSLRTISDRVGRTHFRPTSATSAHVAEFGRTQLRMIKGTIAFSSPLEEVAARLLCFDGVATRQDLPLALMAACNIYRWREHPCVEWKRPDGRLDRRILSALTAQAILRLPPQSIAYTEACAAIHDMARVIYPRHADPLKTVFSTGQAWLFENLPGVLFAHAISTNPLTALPRSTLARDVSQMLVLKPQLEPLGDLSDSDQALGCAWDAFFSAPKALGSGWLIDRLITSVAVNPNLSAHDNKRRAMNRCLELAHEATHADRISTLLLAWAIDLIESGTIQKSNIQPKPIYEYVRLAAPTLREKFLNQDPRELDSKQFGSLYTELIEEAMPGNRKNLASALSSWHRFLMRWLDVPALGTSVHRDIDVLPCANLLWPHEQARILDWLGSSTMDERLRAQIRIAMLIATNLRIRASELFTLRLRSVREYMGDTELEICPLPRDGRPKTQSARRVQPLIDPSVRQEITEWVEQRRAEGAAGEDLLFGDPYHSSRVYRKGQLYVAINRLLKTATGDPDVSLHTLSHTWISQAVRQALLNGESSAAVNPLDVIATYAGHMTVQTSLESYSHLFEEALRHYVDTALSQLRISSADAARWVGVSGAALRQRKATAGVIGPSKYWTAILSQNSGTSFSSVADGIDMATPQRPVWLDKSAIAGFETVLQVCADLAAGKPTAVVAMRCRQSEAWLAQLVLDAADLLRGFQASRGLFPSGRPTLKTALTVLASLDEHRLSGFDFTRISQPKYALLRDYLGRVSISEPFIQAALAAWQQCYRGRYLILDDGGHSPSPTTALAGLLQKSGVPVEQLAITVSTRDPHSPDHEDKVLEARLTESFLCHYRVPPMVDWKTPHPGRPKCYLTWSSTPLPESLSPASCSIAGFNALMLAACLYLQLGNSTTAVVIDQAKKGECQ